MGGPYENLDEKMKQLPNGTIYGIYTAILEAMKKGGIKAEKRENITIIDIGNPEEGGYLAIRNDKDRNSTLMRYVLSGWPARELVMGIGQHFPILEGLDELIKNLSRVEVSTTIKNNEKKCETGIKYCRKISVDIEIIGKSYRNPKQDKTPQQQPPTELGIRLAERSLTELLYLAANDNIDVSVDDEGTAYVTRKDNEEPIFIHRPRYGMGLQSYTVSGELAEHLTKEIGKYILLPEELKNAKNIRVIWEYTRFGYRISLIAETEPKETY